MSLISISYIFSVGNTIVASQHNSNFNVIYNDYNGNIQDVNIASNAAIEYTKLALNNAVKNSDILSTTVFNIGNIPTLSYSNITQFPYVKCTYTVSSGTAGPAGSNNAWTTTALNTKDNDTGSIATLSTNQISLPSGTYKVRSSIPILTTVNGDGIQFKSRIYNITASAVLVEGQSNSAYNAGTTSGDGTTHGNNSFVDGLFTIVSTSTVALQYFYNITVGSTTTTLGAPATSGDNEVYSMIILEKVA